MLGLICGVFIWLRSFIRSRHDLGFEIVALRQQVTVLKRRTKRPHLRRSDRLFWVLLRRVWPKWSNPLLIVKPDTVVRWHRKALDNVTIIGSRARAQVSLGRQTTTSAFVGTISIPPNKGTDNRLISGPVYIVQLVLHVARVFSKAAPNDRECACRRPSGFWPASFTSISAIWCFGRFGRAVNRFFLSCHRRECRSGEPSHAAASSVAPSHIYVLRQIRFRPQHERPSSHCERWTNSRGTWRVDPITDDHVTSYGAANRERLRLAHSEQF